MIRHIFLSQLNPKKHIDEALETLEKIQEVKEGMISNILQRGKGKKSIMPIRSR